MASSRPNPFALSASPETSSRSKLFRPKELTEIVFPDVAMIMHHLFWVKFTIYLENKGYDTAAQNHLFLWAEKNGVREPTESVLYYSILSRYHREYQDMEDVSAGRDTVRNWGLFKSPDEAGYDSFEHLKDRLRNGVNAPEEFDIEQFYDDVFAPEFKSKCVDGDMDMPSLLRAEFAEITVPEDAPEEKRFEAMLTAFVNALTTAFGEYDRLHRRGRGETVISSNISFTTNLISEVGLDRLTPLANTRLTFSSEEIATLLEALQERSDGEFLVGSILLLAYIDPFRDRKHIIADLRRIYDIYTETPDFDEQATANFPSASFTPRVKETLERLCFYWTVNFFLADGEDIARSQLDASQDFIDKAEVEEILNGSGTPEHFVGFIENLERRDWLDYLDPLIARLNDEDEDDIAEFFETLRDCVVEGKSPSEIYLSLLVQRGTISPYTENSYKIKFEPTDSDSASFYGIDSLIGWTTTLLRSVEDE